MPHDKGLPKTGDSQEIGQEAYDCLRAKRPKGWQITELGGPHDFGFDLQVQISVDQLVVHPFRVQLKGTRSPERSADGSFLSIDLSTSTLRYFDNTDEPVLLVLCDLSVDPDEPRDCNLHYVWMREELERIQIALLPPTQKEAAIRVPTVNVLDRSTNLIDEVRKRHRLSRVGHELDKSVSGMDPSLGSAERVGMVEAITRNIGSRNIAFAQALAEPATEVWVNPPRGSLAWLLTEAKVALESGKVETCGKLLDQASEHLEGSTSLEQAEYWYLRGRSHLVRGEDDAATEAFRTATATQPQAKYWAAWAESEMRRRFRADQREDYSDVIAALPEEPDPALWAIKARLLAASHKHHEAIALLDTFDGPESLAARAVVQTMCSKSDEALQACVEGLAIDETKDNTRLLFLILRARARFNIALRGARTEVAGDGDGDSEDEVLPPFGPIGVDAAALRLAWADIEEAVSTLEDVRWMSNAEFVIDIWIATASMLGKQDQILPRVLAVARMRPQQPEVQVAAETLAAQCGKYEAALEANSRLPDSPMKVLRRIAFLHELGRHRDCVELAAANVDVLRGSHQLSGPSTVLAALSAEVLARTDLAEAWREILCGGDQEKQAHAAMLDYLLARHKNQLGGAQVLAELSRVDAQLGHPKPTTLLLFQELDAGKESEAEQFLSVASRLRSVIRLSPMVATKTAVALATLRRWSELLALCEEAEGEFDVTGRIKAFRAFALDQLGRSEEARVIIEVMLEEGMDDGLALNTYVNIMVRCGFAEKAKLAAELILQRAQTRERRIECVKMLFGIEQQANPESPRLVDLAFRMGELAKQEDEVEEGVFLGMATTATAFGVAPLGDARKVELNNRANAFFERFPQSKVLRRVEFPADAEPEAMLSALKATVGISEEHEQQRAELETKLQSGELPLPFAWRPRFALGNVQDVVHLWELAKRSAPEDKKFHLNMIGERWEQRPAESFRSRTPLFDLLTLFVLKDLDLLDKVFQFFPRIAISRGTLGELMKLSQVFSGSIFRGRCLELQECLKPRLAQILQPEGMLGDEEGSLPAASRELRALAASGDYLVYCDDALARMWALREKFESDGMCTLDLLCGLEELGILTSEEVATKLVQLCDWHVGIQIQLRHQLALVPRAVRVAPSVAQAASLLRMVGGFKSIADGIWGPRTDFMRGLNHIGAVVRILVQDPAITDSAIGALVVLWLDRATVRPDTPLTALQLAARITLYAVAPNKLPIAAAQRLWKVYFGVVESIQGGHNSRAAGIALACVAREAGSLDKRISMEQVASPLNIGERLMMGLDIGSEAWVTFSAAYLRGFS
jgi:tetratricopeptide (TPR) repeat protein